PPTTGRDGPRRPGHEDAHHRCPERHRAVPGARSSWHGPRLPDREGGDAEACRGGRGPVIGARRRSPRGGHRRAVRRPGRVRSRRLSPPSRRSFTVPNWPEYRNTSPPPPSGPRYSARVALSCARGHAPGEVLGALQGLRSVIDDRLQADLGGRYDRHSAQSAGTDKLTVTFVLRAATH